MILLRHARHAWILAAATSLGAAPATAQDSLTLREALERTAVHAYANRIARARTDAAAAAELAARRAYLPAVRIEAGLMRTTDPVGTFGTALRQQRITAADFDPQRLNFPAPANNFSGALVVEQPLLTLDAWMATRAADHATSAAKLGATWTASTGQVEVITAYYGATLAAARATTLATATRAAQAHVHQAGAMFEAGLVTKSDALLAATRAAGLEAARLEAARDSVLAIRRLNIVIGADLSRPVVPASGFPADSVIHTTARHVMSLKPVGRADVDGAKAGVDIAEADVSRSRAAFIPRVVSFARQDFNSRAQPFGGANNWTVGVMASWTPFSGGTQLGDMRGAAARRAEAQASLAGVAAHAAIDLERTELSLGVALARLDVMTAAAAQAAEAHRIVTRKYEGGIASVAEVLDAFAAETEARLMLLAARHEVLTATADRLRALGLEPASMAGFDTNHN